MKLDPGMHIGMHLVFFGKSGVTMQNYTRSFSLRLYYQPELLRGSRLRAAAMMMDPSGS
jgi:hypothetical protein